MAFRAIASRASSLRCGPPLVRPLSAAVVSPLVRLPLPPALTSPLSFSPPVATVIARGMGVIADARMERAHRKKLAKRRESNANYQVEDAAVKRPVTAKEQKEQKEQEQAQADDVAPKPIILSQRARIAQFIPKDPLAQEDFLRRYKPITPGLRHRVDVVRPYLWKGRPVHELTRMKRQKGGRGHSGHICVRHQGGGHKRRYRIIDFKRAIQDEPGVIQRFEYDPNRNCNIALVTYAGGKLSYVIAPQELRVGDSILASRKKEIELRVGNAMPLSAMPVGTFIHNVEMKPGRGGQLIRSAGGSGQIIDKGGRPGYAQVRLQSREVRLLQLTCMATIGAVSNPLHKHRVLGKAGRSRWLGIRPSVRGLVMNPVDHPHGGGEGKGGPGRPSCSPTAVLAKGFKTRRRPNKYLLVPRGGLASGAKALAVTQS